MIPYLFNNVRIRGADNDADTVDYPRLMTNMVPYFTYQNPDPSITCWGGSTNAACTDIQEKAAPFLDPLTLGA